MNETEFRNMVVKAAKLCGWKVYFTWNSIHSPAGYLDLTMLRSSELLVVELKTDKGVVTPSQQKWIDAWVLFCQHSHNTHVYVWRPSQWDEIETILQRPIDKP
jgi:hypothetical protein